MIWRSERSYNINMSYDINMLQHRDKLTALS
jgi:hypothetical protein